MDNASQSRKRYFDSSLNAWMLPVAAGEYAVSGEENLLLTTTLGSCISVCLRDPEAQMGGMNHIMLPGRSDGDRVTDSAALYGDFAMEVLINGIIRAGGKKQRLVAKVFGGAQVMAAVEGMAIGDCNSRFVSKFLAREGIPVLANDTGGGHARRIMFSPFAGRVLVNSLGIGAVEAIAKGESVHRNSMQKKEVRSNIEIFR